MSKHKPKVDKLNLDITKIDSTKFIEYSWAKCSISISRQQVWRHKKGSWKDIPFMWQLIYIGYLQ